jgi:hypothetical protein
VGPTASAFSEALWDLPFLEDRPEGSVGGNAIKFKETVDNQPLALIYQTQRLNTYGYRLKLPPGTYAVTLQFCELQVVQPRERVFGIGLQDQTVCERLDIFQEAGRGRALDRTFSPVEARDGELKVTFIPQWGVPCVSGIIVSNTATKFIRKINCGGPAYLDYESDAENYAPAFDFYREWARSLFGLTEGESIGTIFAFVDGHLPRIARWIGGPGALKPDYEDWEKKRPMYEFINSLDEIGRRLKEPYAGRLAYWSQVFQYFRNTARLRCLLGRI